MSGARRNGYTLIEVLISAGIFTIVILGISQTILQMHRYARANLCKEKAYLLATSYFESLLCDTHPYELNKNTVHLRRVDAPETIFNFSYDNNTPAVNNGKYTNLNTFKTHVYEGDDELTVYMVLLVSESPTYRSYTKDGTETNTVENSKPRTEIIPPEGFQALRLKYWYTSPLSDPSVADEAKDTVAYLNKLEHNELYAIRPLNPDDPEYDT